jgi:hypothetical protein
MYGIFVRYFPIAFLFAAVAMFTRIQVWSVETRIQIAIFVILAACYEWLGKPALGHSANRAAFVANAIAATIGILLARWHLEGLCPGVHQPLCLLN